MVTLRKDDFNSAGLHDMWGALVEQAISQRNLHKDTKIDEVDTVTVMIVAAETF